jgi:hypothetical protein
MPDQAGPTLTMLKGVRSETHILSAGRTDEAAVVCIRCQCSTFDSEFIGSLALQLSNTSNIPN